MTGDRLTLETAERDLAEIDAVLAPGDSPPVPEWPAMRRLFVGLIEAYRERLPKANVEGCECGSAVIWHNRHQGSCKTCGSMHTRGRLPASDDGPTGLMPMGETEEVRSLRGSLAAIIGGFHDRHHDVFRREALAYIERMRAVLVKRGPTEGASGADPCSCRAKIMHHDDGSRSCTECLVEWPRPPTGGVSPPTRSSRVRVGATMPAPMPSPPPTKGVDAFFGTLSSDETETDEEFLASLDSPGPSVHACEACGRSLSYYTNGGLQCPVCYKPEPDETPPQGWELCEVGTPADSWYCREAADDDGVFRGTTTKVRRTKSKAIAEARELAAAEPSVPDAPGWWWVKGVHGWQPAETFWLTPLGEGRRLTIEQAHCDDVRNGSLNIIDHEWDGRCLRGALAQSRAAATFDTLWAEWWGDRGGYYTANPGKWITDAERVCRHFFTEGGAPASDADRWAEEARDAGREARKASSQRDALIRAVEQTLHFRAEAYARDDGWSHICDGMNDRLRAALDMDPE